MEITQEQKYHLQRFGRYWDPESLSFVTSSEAVKREPESLLGIRTLSKPIHPEANLFKAAIARAQDPEPERGPEPDPELEEQPETALAGESEKALSILAGLVEKQNREPQLIQLEPQINVLIPEQPVNVTVEMPPVEETQVIERDEEGFISKIKKTSQRKAEGESEPGRSERPRLQDVVRERLGLKPK